MPYKIVIPENPFYAIRSMLEPENWAVMSKSENPKESVLIGYIYPEDGFTFNSEAIVFFSENDLDKLRELMTSVTNRHYENFI